MIIVVQMVLHAGSERIQFSLIYTEGILEGGDGHGRVLLVGVDLEVGKATGEDEEIAGIERGLEEGVVGGNGDKADGERALG